MSLANSSTVTDVGSEEAAVRDLSRQIIAAWALNDGNAFAEVFTEDASVLLPGDVYLNGREHIRGYMSAAYAGPYKGTAVTGDPLDVRFINDTAAVMITVGGVLVPGETEVAPERAIRATWTCAKVDSVWKIAAYQNSPIQKP